MKTNKEYGTKERLFEMMEKVNNISLNEHILPMDKKNEIIKDFVDYVDKRLKLNGDVPNIKLIDDNDFAKKEKSFGGFMPSTDEISVVIKNRNLADVLRTIAHELVHHKQAKNGQINPNSGETGSKEENEANAVAGILMRDFGKNNPIIYE